jgi:hypothetical protein
MQQFDPNIPGLISGDVTTVTVIDPALTFPGFEVGNHVLDSTKPFQVKVDWVIQGFLAPLWLQALGGNWDVSVYAESLGGGNEIRLGSNDAVAADPNVLSYTATIDVQGGLLQEHAPGTDVGGIYKLVVAVFLDSNLPGQGFDMIGFNEGPIVQVESPV